MIVVRERECRACRGEGYEAFCSHTPLEAMKTAFWMLTGLMAGVLAGAGCKKAEDEPGPTPVYYGVRVDLPKLDSEFTNANQEVQASARLAKQCLRYAQVPQALAELEKLARNTSLTGPQKKVVEDLIKQTRQVIANSTPAAQH